MRRSTQVFLGMITVAAVSACRDATTAAVSGASAALAVTNAYTTTPVGYNEVTSSFSADSAAPGPFQPHMGPMGPGGPGAPGGPDGPPPKMAGPGFGLGLMGGGLGGPFFGDGIGAGFGPGPFGNGALPPSCTYSAQTGIVTCPSVTIGGLTVTREAEYTTAAGVAQASVDSTTNTISTQTQVSGTVTRRDSSTSTVTETSSQTVSGLAAGSTQRTVNGTSSGTETTEGTSPQGAFTSSGVIGDTTTGLVLPAPQQGVPTYPTAGQVTRAMSLSITAEGSTTTTSRREVVTYNGTATATVVITQDGSTQTCSLPLPHGKLSCQ